MVNKAILQIESRENSPCKLIFSPPSPKMVVTKKTSAVRKSRPSPKVVIKSTSVVLRGNCDAIKADGKKCTYKAKCLSKDKKKKYCGVHSKFCK